MPKPRATRLETPTSRARLPVRKKPYYVKIAPGIHLGYRRNDGPGAWSVRCSDGHGGVGVAAVVAQVRLVAVERLGNGQRAALASG